MKKIRYSEYEGKGRKEQLDIAYYGLKALGDPAFRWVLNFYLSSGGPRLPHQKLYPTFSIKEGEEYFCGLLRESFGFPKNAKLMYHSPRKEKKIFSDCGEVFRRIADSVEAIRMVHVKKEYHEPDAVKLLVGTMAPKGAELSWAADFHPTFKDYLKIHYPKATGDDGISRKIRALCQAMGIPLNQGKRGKDTRPRSRAKRRTEKT